MEALVQFLPLIILILVMYFLMIRPQKKKDKQIQDKLDLAAEGDSRKGCLVYQAQHNGVRRTDQCQHKGLDDHRQYE